jgi:hypothetical protein
MVVDGSKKIQVDDTGKDIAATFAVVNVLKSAYSHR